MRKLTILLCTAILAASCVKTIDKVLPRGDMSLLELKIQGQLGTAVIERDEDECSATVYVMARADFPYAAVPVEGIVVSAGATASVTKGGTLNFSNPERKAKITVTSESGNSLDWFIYLETYDAFYVGEWKILECKLACNQRVSGSGDGSWTTQLSGSEFGTTGLAEYDDRIIITMNPEMQDNMLTGTLEHTAGADGEYGHFWGVYPPYSVEEPLDMDPRLRHLLHPGKSDWKLDLTTGQMRLTQNNITSTMIFGTEGDNVTFRFILPDAGKEPAQNGFYDNMWRSSTELFYVVYKIK